MKFPLKISSDYVEYNGGKSMFVDLRSFYSIPVIFAWDRFHEVYAVTGDDKVARWQLGVYKKETAKEIVKELETRKQFHPTTNTQIIKEADQNRSLLRAVIRIIIGLAVIFIAPNIFDPILKSFGASLDLRFGIFVGFYSFIFFGIFGLLLTKESNPTNIRRKKALLTAFLGTVVVLGALALMNSLSN
jgi:hypothetical protein